MSEEPFEVTDEALELKDKFMELLDKKATTDGIIALTICLTEIISQTAPNKDLAFDGVAAVTASILTSLQAFDERGLCYWNKSIQ